MFYQLKVYISGVTSWYVHNKTKEEILIEYLCPFINNEVSYNDKYLRNFSSFGGLVVHITNKPIDSDWPVKKADLIKDDKLREWDYKAALEGEFEKLNSDVTQELYIEALTLIESGKYVEGRKKYIKKLESKFCFFICPFGNNQIDHNYEFVIKPTIEKYQFEIKRADEISHTKLITEIIIDSINKSKFLIADLTEEKPNCYYEVGYAHSLGKPVIIIAKEGTPRHFDIAAYKWIHYVDYQDLKPKLEKEVEVIVKMSV
jgi:hypothetical protein